MSYPMDNKMPMPQPGGYTPYNNLAAGTAPPYPPNFPQQHQQSYAPNMQMQSGYAPPGFQPGFTPPTSQVPLPNQPVSICLLSFRV